MRKTYIEVGGVKRMSPLYNMWFDMYQRCTSERSRKIRPHYYKTELHPDWYNFHTFADWAEHQRGYNEFCEKGIPYQLDKDLLGEGTLYSPDNCCFLPKEVNAFLRTNLSRANTSGVTGVVVLPNGKYRACIRDSRVGKNIHLGCFVDIDEAASAYKTKKQEICRYLAEKYKNTISQKAFDKLCQ
jgi:hypothetical protein